MQRKEDPLTNNHFATGNNRNSNYFHLSENFPRSKGHRVRVSCNSVTSASSLFMNKCSPCSAALAFPCVIGEAGCWHSWKTCSNEFSYAILSYVRLCSCNVHVMLSYVQVMLGLVHVMLGYVHVMLGYVPAFLVYVHHMLGYRRVLPFSPETEPRLLRNEQWEARQQ